MDRIAPILDVFINTLLLKKTGKPDNSFRKNVYLEPGCSKMGSQDSNINRDQ